jgi:hypothetical protein
VSRTRGAHLQRRWSFEFRLDRRRSRTDFAAEGRLSPIAQVVEEGSRWRRRMISRLPCAPPEPNVLHLMNRIDRGVRWMNPSSMAGIPARTE